jgi:gluconate 2-dehydrogenase gamma chain
MNRREWVQRVVAAVTASLAGKRLSAEVLHLGREVHRASNAASESDLKPSLLRELSAVCERIMPSDETPGAIAAGVPAFIDHMLSAWYDPPEREHVIMGLRRLDDQAQQNLGHPFVAVTPAEQDALLLELDAAGADSWFALVKYLTIWGYYTSEIGITQELQQGPPPGRYDGCVPYAPHLRSGANVPRTPAKQRKSHAAQ